MPSESLPHVHVHAREPPLEQLVKEPVLIGWRDPKSGQYQHVGCLQDAGQPTRGKLVMWIGRATAGGGQRLLINFRLPFSTRSTLYRSKKDMFLVVPAERLRLDLRRVEANTLPEATLFQLRAAGLADLREGLVRARFSLGNPAYVVMPKLRRPLAKPLTGVPCRLMSSMRSLSGVQEFDVYLSRGSVELELQVIRSILIQDDVRTPELDVHATYNGGFGGGKNLWQSYPCEENGNLSWNPLVDDDPLPYEMTVTREDTPLSPSAILKETRSRLRTDPTPKISPDGLVWRVKPSPDIGLMRPTNIETKRPPVMYCHKRKVSEAISDYEERHLGKRDGGGTTQEKVKAGPPAAQTIAAPHQGPAGAPAASYASSRAPYNGTVRAERSSVIDDERHKELALARRAAAANTPAPDPPAHKTTDHRPVWSPPTPAKTPPPPSPPPHLVDHEAATLLHLRAAVLDCLRARAAPHPTSIPPPPLPSPPPTNLSPLHTPHLFLELAEFLAAASRIDPRAHETHGPRLLALGAAAREGDVAGFDANMRLCQRRVLRDAWARRRWGRDDPVAGENEKEDEEELLGECSALLDWLNGSVCRIAGTLMMGMLAGLGPAPLPAYGQVMGRMGGAAAEDMRREWTENLVKVRAAAFWAFG